MKKLLRILPILLSLLASLNLRAEGGKQKIILDCDLGGDIDDAFALALILSSPELEVMGITLDHGLTEKRGPGHTNDCYNVHSRDPLYTKKLKTNK